MSSCSLTGAAIASNCNDGSDEKNCCQLTSTRNNIVTLMYENYVVV